MAQKSLIYTFVARGTVILAEYTEYSGNFNSIAFQCLQKLPSANNKFTYNCDGHTFNYLVDNGYSKSYSFPPFSSVLNFADGLKNYCSYFPFDLLLGFVSDCEILRDVASRDVFERGVS